MQKNFEYYVKIKISCTTAFEILNIHTYILIKVQNEKWIFHKTKWIDFQDQFN